jgi:hypothetical protein
MSQHVAGNAGFVVSPERYEITSEMLGQTVFSKVYCATFDRRKAVVEVRFPLAFNSTGQFSSSRWPHFAVVGLAEDQP